MNLSKRDMKKHRSKDDGPKKEESAKLDKNGDKKVEANTGDKKE